MATLFSSSRVKLEQEQEEKEEKERNGSKRLISQRMKTPFAMFTITIICGRNEPGVPSAPPAPTYQRRRGDKAPGSASPRYRQMDAGSRLFSQENLFISLLNLTENTLRLDCNWPISLFSLFHWDSRQHHSYGFKIINNTIIIQLLSILIWNHLTQYH